MNNAILRFFSIRLIPSTLFIPSILLVPLALCAFAGVSHAAEYFVANDGDDTSSGTAQRPFASLAKAATLVNPGDTIYVHGGTYKHSAPVKLSQSGTEKAPIRVWAVERERPVLDLGWKGETGIRISGAWWHLRGITVARADNKGFQMDGPKAHNNTLEAVTAWANGNSGFALSGETHDNLLLNCDSYENYDFRSYGQNADGFALKFGIGEGNRLVGCRSWNNSDDGYDCWHATGAVTFENCYAWANGVNIWHDPEFTGNGNGFKLGQLEGAHKLYRCAAWDQPQRGFDLNGNTTGVTVEQCTAARCKVNFGFGWPEENAEKHVLRNNLSFQGEVEMDKKIDNRHNSWNIPGVKISANDFDSLDPTYLEAPRDDDGSLPDGPFLSLSDKSQAIDAGVDLGQPFEGKAPDLGAFETPAPAPGKTAATSAPSQPK